jgi:5-methylcytosine-specific restriction endonuclease McrA
VLRRDPCAYCDARTGEAGTVDHVAPKAAGERSWRENLVGCCWRCNQAKSDTTLLVWLLDRPRIGAV